MDCFIESELWVHKFFNGVVNCRARANGADPFPPLSIVLQLERDADPWQQDVWFNMDVRSYHCQCRLLDNDTYPSKEKRTIAPWFLLKSTFGFSMDGEPASINFTLFLVLYAPSWDFLVLEHAPWSSWKRIIWTKNGVILTLFKRWFFSDLVLRVFVHT